MRKLVLFTILSIVALCFAASAYAGTLKPGQKTTCNNANKITLEASGNSSKGDRGYSQLSQHGPQKSCPA
jgi:hypothetical protein